MGREFTVVVERDGEGYLVASVPSLPGCHTQARSMDELLERIKEAIQRCLEVQGEEAQEQLELVGIQRVTVRVDYQSNAR
ncbi:MAG: type II toxin-antitoxin system HicB family antitoxin [Chloroflexi bacterium]|nr:type II toxin-antitoxin system HicB family antitoxin [Chloroflexota bacterium]